MPALSMLYGRKCEEWTCNGGSAQGLHAITDLYNDIIHRLKPGQPPRPIIKGPPLEVHFYMPACLQVWCLCAHIACR